MRRSYNKRAYRIFRKVNKTVREKSRPNPFSPFKDKGMIGKIIDFVGNKLIKRPIHKLSYKLVGKNYDSRYDSPFKGSILYSLYDYIIYALLLIIISIALIMFS